MPIPSSVLPTLPTGEVPVDCGHATNGKCLALAGGQAFKCCHLLVPVRQLQVPAVRRDQGVQVQWRLVEARRQVRCSVVVALSGDGTNPH